MRFFAFILLIFICNFANANIGDGWECFSLAEMGLPSNSQSCRMTASGTTNTGEKFCATNGFANHIGTPYMHSTCVGGITVSNELCNDNNFCCCYAHHTYDLICGPSTSHATMPPENCAKGYKCLENFYIYNKDPDCDVTIECPGGENDCEIHEKFCERVKSCEAPVNTTTTPICEFEQISGCCYKDSDCEQNIGCYELQKCNTDTEQCEYKIRENCCETDSHCNPDILCETPAGCVNSTCQFEHDNYCCNTANDCPYVPCAKNTMCISSQCQYKNVMQPSQCCEPNQTSIDACCLDQLDCPVPEHFQPLGCENDECKVKYKQGIHASVVNTTAVPSDTTCSGYCQNNNCVVAITWEPNDNLKTMNMTDTDVKEYIIETYAAENSVEIARVPSNQHYYDHSTICQKGSQQIYFISAINDQEEEIGYETMIMQENP